MLLRASLPTLVLSLLLMAPAAGAKPSRVATGQPRRVLPFLSDDYTRAVAQAKARKVPIFVEAWAPW